MAFAPQLTAKVKTYQTQQQPTQPSAMQRRADTVAPPAAPVAPAPAALPTFTPSAAPKLTIDRSGVNQQFDAARNRAAQTEAAQVQGQKDALARRAAALGGGPGGAFIKAEQNAMGDSAERLGQANQEIDAARQAKEQELAQLEAQANFQAAQQQQGFDLEKYKTDTANTLATQDQAWKKYESEYRAGRDAVQDKAVAEAQKQADKENRTNVQTSILTSIDALLTKGRSPEQIKSLIGATFGNVQEDYGINIDDFFGIQGVTAQNPAPAAPARAVRAVSSSSSRSGANGSGIYPGAGPYQAKPKTTVG